MVKFLFDPLLQFKDKQCSLVGHLKSYRICVSVSKTLTHTHTRKVMLFIINHSYTMSKLYQNVSLRSHDLLPSSTIIHILGGHRVQIARALSYRFSCKERGRRVHNAFQPLDRKYFLRSVWEGTFFKKKTSAMWFYFALQICLLLLRWMRKSDKRCFRCARHGTMSSPSRNYTPSISRLTPWIVPGRSRLKLRRPYMLIRTS